ncbi:MAG TPA: sugar kinase [Thermomicrobiales bacterium]|nr:sugar kinase [Thermomicrobiales bacterium]
MSAQKIGRVVCFGEAMLRLTPPGHERLERTRSLDVTAGGAELNTAVALRGLDVPATWVSVLPDTPLGRLIARQARAADVDLSGVVWVSEAAGRTGLYFLEEGVDPRPSAVTYDRAGSAMARVEPGAFDWPVLLAGASALHISGITPAISEGCRAATRAAMDAAKEAKVPVAFDLNYRSKLWTEEDARVTFQDLAPRSNILFASRNGLRTFFGIDGDRETVLRAARERLGLDVIVMTRKRNKGSRGIRLASVAIGADQEIATSPWRAVEIVDRLGGGDAFAAGFLAAYLEDPDDLSRACGLGTAAAALKHTMPGDFLAATKAEIEAVLAADEEGGVLQR